MAVAYAYSLLGDFQLAEDAAQEAFIQAYRDLKTLREPLAFSSWLRRIVFNYCDRITRKKRVETVPTCQGILLHPIKRDWSHWAIHMKSIP
jgi:DNA-directed RNA polymerase specialized sigma24 family protein